MKIKLMADSTCDLSQEVLDRYNISIAPLIITIDGNGYRDRLDISNDEFYKNLLAYKSLPTTSMPSPESYISCIQNAIKQGYDKILCICMSSRTSGSYHGAILAKDLFY